MICQPCRDKKHEECPSKAAQDSNKPPMALSPEGERIQLTGLCPCQHRVSESLDFHEEIHRAQMKMLAAGILPPICTMCDNAPSDLGSEFVAQVGAA